MSRTVLLLVACAAHFLAACAGTTVGDQEASQSSGIYLDNRDTSVRPQDDFFQFVNGGWLASNDIPDDKSRDGSFERLREAADADVRNIIEQAAAQGGAEGSAEQRIAILYSSFMDEERINALGIRALEDELSIIDAIDSERSLLEFFALAQYSGVTSPLGISVYPDFLEPERYRLYLYQSGLGLPNSDYYTDDSEKGREIITAYHAYIRDIFMALGYSREAAEAATASSWALELALAAHHRPPESDRDYTRWHNLFGPGHEALPASVSWDDYFSGFELSPETVISVAQPEYIDGFAQVFQSTPLSTWRDYLKLRVASSFAPYMSQELQDLAFDFYSTTLEGTPQMKPRWQRGVSFVNNAIGDSVGQIYVREHFPPSAKAQMDQLVANLIVAYRESIESLEWMSEETRANALIKLNKFTANIGYPDKWKDYSTMGLGNELLPNVRDANRWDIAYQLAKLPTPVDKHEWTMNVQTVNAYYSPVQNSINFPAAILQAPFFDPQADEAVNYGAIGSIIGHEIGHGFDDSGAQFDGDGRLYHWWTESDKAAFQARTARLIEQYNGFEILPGVAVNGTFTQSENIGDLAGASIAYKAYIYSLGGKPAPVLDGYTGEQRFFIGFAQAFLAQSREERARQMIKIDVHSPEIFRVNGTLPNIDGFYEAFNVQPGDLMYRDVDQRVTIW